MIQNDIDVTASRVISIEADALRKMAENLPPDFKDAVGAILKTNGRVIVSGVGKSGHIGNKIAATLASTGTPASFVHATEASHGDLGMVTAADFCLLISNSGETTELRDIVAHTRRFGIPMAAISSNENSTLMNAADYKLTLTTAPEACSIGMAPTTSTTLALALGDALAVTLMEQRNFQPADFKVFHPGGKLGASMSTVAQLMRPLEELAVIGPKTSMQELILKMTHTGYGIAALIGQDSKIIGVISDGDLRRNIDNLFDLDPITIATKDPISVLPSDFIASALNKMERNRVYSILVLDDNKPIGLLRMHDLLRAGVS
jgi:arabinose-5-phosphate isomerase